MKIKNAQSASATQPPTCSAMRMVRRGLVTCSTRLQCAARGRSSVRNADHPERPQLLAEMPDNSLADARNGYELVWPNENRSSDRSRWQ